MPAIRVEDAYRFFFERTEVAQTLVGLGVDLSGIITRGSLQSGIALAIQGPRSRSN